MSMKSSARSSAKAKARRMTKVTTGKIDASGWHQPMESRTPRMRHAYKDGGKVSAYVGEVEKEAGCKPRGDKRPRKMDGGPMTGQNDPRQYANNMMQKAAAMAPVSGNSPIPTFKSAAQGKSPLRMGIAKGGKVAPKMAFKGDAKEDMKPEVKPEIAKKVLAKTPAGTAYPQVPKKLPLSGNNAIVPDMDGGPPMKKGGRAKKAGGGMIEESKRLMMVAKDPHNQPGKIAPAPSAPSAETPPKDIPGGAKKGGRVGKACGGGLGKIDADGDMDGSKKNEKVEEGNREKRAGGGRVKGKTNINIIIAPGGGGAEAAPAGPPMMGAPMMKPPGMPPMPPAPPAGGPPGAPAAGGGMPANPLAGMPPQAIAAMMGGAPGGGASMPPAGPPRLPMRAAGGRLVRETAGAGSGLGRLEKADKQGRKGL
jgi:hypothetical protein